MACLLINIICSLLYGILVKFVLKNIICGKIRITTSKGITVREFSYLRSIKYSLCIAHRSCGMSAHYYGLIGESLHETPLIDAYITRNPTAGGLPNV